ncbi:uncharacterized protein LOC124916509 [Impatiens glandulifera]|uniref:uncharacterized protein LOC124916509 n=1 Tax=Impatiens glandulifera TaxID=253017 RepID=UPI001FB0E532|nr:uncharacterized protein LOC124916509 [Impatiens glandulifera]XP_047313193.1 uncharacterized protein LOC124916509 [Impatiens glandulifera]
MDQKFEEAVRAKENAERRFVEKDYMGAKSYALKAQMICPELEGIAQMVATFEVYIASEIKLNGESDFYSILGLEPCLERTKVKKQYRKMSVLLHPDKNKTIGADGAFKLISEAWTLLSDNKKRASYNIRRNQVVSSQLLQTANTHQRHDTFWTVCTSCQVQYEYLRKYLNKRLSCKNCRGVFVAVETGLAPIAGSYPYCAWSCDNNVYNSVSYPPTTNNNIHSGYGSDYSSNVSFQWSSNPGSSSQTNGNLNQPRSDEPANLKVGKKMKVEMEGASRNVEITPNGNGNPRNNIYKMTTPIEIPSRQFSQAPFDARKFLMGFARTEIHKKLEEMKPKGTQLCGFQFESKELIVPDPDFHDFDKDRTEDCFKPKQIWAIYDEDGMPRLYCLIRHVISVKPFKMHISYLSSKTDSEFGSVNWISSGFTKSCGGFRAWNADVIDQVNIFSHLLDKEKAGRGGCVRIYPRIGTVWAIYRNWSPDWNRRTPIELRRQYEMVEILDDYSEELGVCVAPVMKLDGFKTVYVRNSDKISIRWISRREMLRFSHQVPSWPLRDEGFAHLPDNCWDLDPAATPDELLQVENDKNSEEEEKPFQVDNLK